MPNFKAPPIPRPLSQTTNNRPAVGQQPNRATTPPVQQEPVSFNQPVAPVMSAPVENPREEVGSGLYDDNFAADLNLPVKLLQTKYMAGILGATLLLGMIFGALFFSTETQQITQGLTGVVYNQDFIPNTPRCGIAPPGQRCVLYIMNSTRQDKYAENFFTDAVKLTGVASFNITMANSTYAKRLIKPGYIAQINIPDIR